MKSIIIGFVLLLNVCLLNAQSSAERMGGITFMDHLSWAQVKAKAKAENKIIFLDVYATWCGPCKQMDREVYTHKEVGNFFNAHFISVKVQVDQTSNDAPEIKAWYADAKYISQHYETRELPSFLFLDCEGNIVHRDLGFKNVTELLLLGKTANDPSKSFAVLRDSYQKGKLALEKLGAFALTANAMKQKDLSGQVAKDYKTKFLDHQEEAVLINTENVIFVKNFPSTLTTKDPYFKLLLSKPKLMDSVFDKKDISKQLVNYVVTKEELIPVLWENNRPKDIQPDWERLRIIIAKKHSKNIADRTILAQQMSWYKAREDWPMAVKYNIKKIDEDGLDTAGLGKAMLNNLVFNIIFKHSTDTIALNKGLKWMEILLKTNPERYGWLDTYANLLYKIGKTKEALYQQEKAVNVIKGMINELVKKQGGGGRLSIELSEYEDRLNKMKQGLPTWED